MKEILQNLFKFDRQLLGEGYDNALQYIKFLLTELKIIEIPSGTKVGGWTVPDEWILKDGWVKFNGEKIIDYQKNPLSVIVGSLNISRIVDLEELKAHLHYSEDMPNATPFTYKFYEKTWGFSVPYNQVKEPNTEAVGITKEDGTQFIPKTKDKLKEGQYEVFINSEYKPGKMKLGVHTIKGKSDREILLFAHLDHAHQANDNLSAVVCLIDLANKIKADHTVKIIFCPETIGSIAYVHTQDISKIDFMIAVDICGNTNSILLQKSFNPEDKINRVAHLASHSLLQDIRKGVFRSTIGSDEYVFNDPLVGIPGIMLSTWPYREYHTSEDTPEKIDYQSIENTGKMILKIIEIWEQDFIPKREVKGPLMRSKYGVQSSSKQTNLMWDYFWYSIDGKRSLAELCCLHGLVWESTLKVILDLERNGELSRIDIGKVGKQKTSKKKHKGLSRRADVPRKHKKVSKGI